MNRKSQSKGVRQPSFLVLASPASAFPSRAMGCRQYYGPQAAIRIPGTQASLSPLTQGGQRRGSGDTVYIGGEPTPQRRFHGLEERTSDTNASILAVPGEKRFSTFPKQRLARSVHRQRELVASRDRISTPGKLRVVRIK